MAAEPRLTLGARASSAVLVLIAGCSLVYEMSLGATLAELYGDSVYYFSLTVAGFILFMGVGSFLSAPLRSHAFHALVWVEVLLTVLGGSSSSALTALTARVMDRSLTLMLAGGLIAVIGVLTGLEIPLVLFLRSKRDSESRSLSRLLVADQAGGLIGSVLFALVLLPALQANGAAIAAALVNAAVALYLVARLPLRRLTDGLLVLATLCAVVLGVRFALHAKEFRTLVDQRIYGARNGARIQANFRTRYQKVVVTTRERSDARGEERAPWVEVWLNGSDQASGPLGSETDAYHHGFVHPAMALARQPRRVLILGGGDGLPAKEVLKYGSEVERVVMVDLDEEWVRFAATNELLRKHNHGSLLDPRMQILYSDAFAWVRRAEEKFDVVLVDFPEGVDFVLSRSYSLQFMRDLRGLLAEGGVIAFQHDTYDDPAYWCVVKTMRAAGFSVLPYHTMKGELEGLYLLTAEPPDLSGYEARLDAHAFVRRALTPDRATLEEFADPSLQERKTAGLKVNSFYRPVYLDYRRTEFRTSRALIPWW